MDHLVTALDNAEEASEDALAKISRYAKEYIEKKNELDALEAQVKDKKSEVNKLSQELIPESMMAVNMQSFKLATGQTVSIKPEISCSVKDYHKMQNFLEERGDDAILKIALELGKLPKNVVNMIVTMLHEKFHVDASAKMTIHPQTLNAYFRKLCLADSEGDVKLPLAELDEDMVSVFTYYKTTVK